MLSLFHGGRGGLDKNENEVFLFTVEWDGS